MAVWASANPCPVPFQPVWCEERLKRARAHGPWYSRSGVGDRDSQPSPGRAW
jgi:hypothetical protein